MYHGAHSGQAKVSGQQIDVRMPTLPHVLSLNIGSHVPRYEVALTMVGYVAHSGSRS